MKSFVVRRDNQKGTRRIDESIRLIKIRLVSLIKEPDEFILFNIVGLDILRWYSILSETRSCIESPLPGRVGSGSTCSMKSRMWRIARKDLFDGILKVDTVIRMKGERNVLRIISWQYKREK